MLDYDSIIMDRFPFVVVQDGKYGSLDDEGNLEIPCEYDYLNAAGAFFIIKDGEKYGTLSLENKVVEKPQFDKIEKGLYDMFGMVYLNDKMGLLNIDGTILLPIEYDSIEKVGVAQVKATKDGETFNFNCTELQLKAMDK